MVYDALKDDTELGWSNKDDKDAYKPFAEFQRVYGASVRNSLSDRRQYTQTQCLNALVGTYCPLLTTVTSKFVHCSLISFPVLQSLQYSTRTSIE